MDFVTLEFGGVTVLAMAFGLTQFFKTLFSLDGKKATTLAMAMGILVIGGVELIQFLPEVAIPIAEAIYRSIAAGLTAAGFYKFVARNG